MVCKESTSCNIRMIYYNSDGTEGGEMCGNGIRCFLNMYLKIIL